jgi:hypothetical protein
VIAVKVSIIRYVDDSQPGIVECKLVDARGREWTVIEKVPVVSLVDLDASSNYPQPGVIGCLVVERRQQADGREVVTISTEKPWDIESTTGETRFDVVPEQLIECE